jgi:hypothetical protein
MYKTELDIISQHSWVEGSKYLQLAKLNLEMNKDEEECEEILVEEYGLMKPKEFKSKWNRFQHIAPRIEWMKK